MCGMRGRSCLALGIAMTRREEVSEMAQAESLDLQEAVCVRVAHPLCRHLHHPRYW
jgi:hypothetical protein